MKSEPESRTPENVYCEVVLGEQLKPRLWLAETPIGKEVHIFLKRRDADAGRFPETGDRVRVEFHPFEMARARIVSEQVLGPEEQR